MKRFLVFASLVTGFIVCFKIGQFTRLPDGVRETACQDAMCIADVRVVEALRTELHGTNVEVNKALTAQQLVYSDRREAQRVYDSIPEGTVIVRSSGRAEPPYDKYESLIRSAKNRERWDVKPTMRRLAEELGPHLVGTSSASVWENRQSIKAELKAIHESHPLFYMGIVGSLLELVHAIALLGALACGFGSVIAVFFLMEEQH